MPKTDKETETLKYFHEDRPEFKGFNQFYARQIEPFFMSIEGERKTKVRNAVMIGVGLSVGALILSFHLLVNMDTPKFFAAIPPCMAIVLGALFFSHQTSGLRDGVKSHLMRNICGFVGWEYTQKEFMPPNMMFFQNYGLVAKRVDRSKFEDQMKGTAHGADFEFCEAHLERKTKDSKGRTSWSTVFRGVLMEIDFHREFLGQTVVLRDKSIFNPKKRGDMKRVGLVDPVFEKIFEAYGTDQVEARYLLTPTFMQRLVDLETSMSGKKARFAFLYGKLYIAVEAPDQFEAGSMFQSMLDMRRTEKVLNEVGAIFDLVDGVMKPADPRR